MSILVNSTLAPRGTTYPLADANDLQGGYHVVADSTARDAIPANFLYDGMIVYVTGESTRYRRSGSGWVRDVANAPTRVYYVTSSSNGSLINETIQTAVAASPAPSALNPVIVVVYPRGAYGSPVGSWDADITLQPGVHLVAAWDTHGAVRITGTVTYAPSSGVEADNLITVQGIQFLAPGALPAIRLQGSIPADLYLRRCIISASSTAGCAAVSNQSSSATGKIIMERCEINAPTVGTKCLEVTGGGYVESHESRFVGDYPADLLTGSALFWGSSLMGNNHPVNIGGSAKFYGCDIHQLAANGSSIYVGAAGALTLSRVVIDTPVGAGKAMDGVAGGTVSWGEVVHVTTNNAYNHTLALTAFVEGFT